MTTNPGHTFASQLLTLVIRPTLNSMSLGGTPAEMLILGTAAVESGFSAIKQIGGGPALSMWQIEPTTAGDAWKRAKPPVKGLVHGLSSLDGGFGDAHVLANEKEIADSLVSQLPGNLYLGAAMCRLVYYLKPFDMVTAIPHPLWLAMIWKRHYNTLRGAGTEQQFIDAWNRFDLGSLWV